jgi:hypothetical protein
MIQNPRTKHRARTGRAVRLEVEALEDRRVPALVVTDMTQLAQEFGRHDGATTLWLNFDGYAAEGVSPFQSISGNRNQDIQDVLFKTQQIFAPFDVIIRRRLGDGSIDQSSSGNTTIFIGDNASYGTGPGAPVAGVPGAGHHGAGNGYGAYTPWSSADFPGGYKGTRHRPNSDAFDIAFVDPLYDSGGVNISRGALWIAQAIAHEAGHTFGLAHVLSNPDPEIMSYDAANVRFVNKTLNITDLNYSPSTGTTYNEPLLQPQWRTTLNVGPFELSFLNTITTQNSYTYLQAALGARSTAGDMANVADAGAVDSAYADGATSTLTVGSTFHASINRRGDFDVYSFTPETSRWVIINAKRGGASTVDPVLLVYNSAGQSVLAFDDDSGAGVESKLELYVTAGHTYKVAVGAADGSTTGSYVLSITNNITTPGVIVTVAGSGTGGSSAGSAPGAAASGSAMGARDEFFIQAVRPVVRPLPARNLSWDRLPSPSKSTLDLASLNKAPQPWARQVQELFSDPELATCLIFAF